MGVRKEGRERGRERREKKLQSKIKSDTECRDVKNIESKYAEGYCSFSYYHISLSC